MVNCVCVCVFLKMMGIFRVWMGLGCVWALWHDPACLGFGTILDQQFLDHAVGVEEEQLQECSASTDQSPAPAGFYVLESITALLCPTTCPVWNGVPGLGIQLP